MNLVVDANLVAATALPLPYSGPAQRKMVVWKRNNDEIFAPTLWEYEITTILRKAVVVKLLSPEEAAGALHRIQILNLKSVPPTEVIHLEALKWTERLGHSKAYDAQYLAVAQSLGAVLWTGDQRLSNRANQLGVDWVRWVGME